MKLALFSARKFDREFFEKANANYGFEIDYFDTHLGAHSLGMTEGYDAVCVFVNDQLGRDILEGLKGRGVKWVALRCAGFNQLDVEAAKSSGLRVCRVPAYSPYAIAEHAVAMIQTLNRKTHKAYNRVREQNFSLDGLLGFDLHGKTVGVVGTGHIGSVFAKIMLGFGCRVLAYDPKPNDDLRARGVEATTFDELLRRSDIISLHCPLIRGKTEYMIDETALGLVKRGAMLINTSRGGLVDTRAIIKSLKNGQLGSLGVDVYEQEEQLFFRDRSSTIIDDDLIQRLVSFPNVLVTAHQAFFTDEALTQVSGTTLQSLALFEQGKAPVAPTLVV